MLDLENWEISSFSPHSLRGSSFCCVFFVGGVVTDPAALLFAQKSRSCSRHPPKNRRFFYRFSTKKIQGLAFKVLFVGGVVTEPVAPPIFENCVPARDILKILRFSVFINILKLHSSARKSDFLKFWSSSYLQNRALARDILEIWSMHLHRNRSKLRSRAAHSENFDHL